MLLQLRSAASGGSTVAATREENAPQIEQRQERRQAGRNQTKENLKKQEKEERREKEKQENEKNQAREKAEQERQRQKEVKRKEGGEKEKGLVEKKNQGQQEAQADAPAFSEGGIEIPDRVNGEIYNDYDGAVQDRAVEWLGGDNVPDITDFYSASWFMSVPTFLQANTSAENIVSLEDGVFGVVNERDHLLRMSLDYLDLSVEHLSHWWRKVGVPVNDAGYNFTVTQLTKYVHARRRPPLASSEKNVTKKRGVLHPTIAVVSFSQVQLDDDERIADRDQEISTLALAATVSSILQVGVGRVVVVGSDPRKDRPVVREAFRRVAAEGAAFTADGDPDAVVAKVGGDTELLFAPVSSEMCKTELEPNNVPRGTLAGLHRALSHHQHHPLPGNESSGGNDGAGGDDDTWTTKWLGDDPGYWKYVYYSEGDTLLQTRRSVFKDLAAKMDEGLVLAPSRLQLIAYEGDIPDFSRYHEPNEYREDYRLVPADFKTPLVLNSGELVTTAEAASKLIPYQHCCDEQKGDYKPGKVDGIRCSNGDWWYQCGFNKEGNHSRLEPYEFIRLSRGTGITALASTEHGRRCIPSRVPCRRRRKDEEDNASSR